MAFSYPANRASADTTTAGSPAIAFPSNVAQNSIVMVAMKISATLASKSVASIADSRGTVYALLARLNDGNGGSHIEVWYGLKTPSAGANTVTLTMGAGTDVSLRWFISEFGADGTQVLDQAPRTLAQIATTTPNTGGNFTPAGNNELLYAATELFTGSTITETGSWTEDFFVVAAPNTRVEGEYWIQTAGTPTDAGFSLGTSDDTATVLGAFKEVAAGAVAPFSGGRTIYKLAPQRWG